MRAIVRIFASAVGACGSMLLILAGRPIVAQQGSPLQFPEVADSAWTIEKPLVGHERKCQDGKVLAFPCQNVDLLSFLPINAIGGHFIAGGNLAIVSDIWGWTDSASGREFVLIGQPEGTSFVEISDPVHPRYLGKMPHLQNNEQGIARGIKVYKNYALVVSEGAGDGMQVFDLTQLLTTKDIPATFQENAHYDRVNSVHNLVVDPDAGFAFAVGNSSGGETCGGGLHMIDIRKPLTPTFAGCYPETLGGSRTGSGYIHDAQCVVYHGPDQKYRGQEICLNSAGTGLGIVDVTDKSQPKPISVGRYPSVAFTHQGWLTDDQRYFFLDDEYDERSTGSNTRTIVFDLNDLGDPVVATEFVGTTNAIDHNQFVRGRYVYQSNYSAGLRILDIADPRNPKEVAYFDTDVFGRANIFGFSGSWGNYPFFKSGVVAVSSMGEGLFILRQRTP